MKLVRYGRPGKEKPGLVDTQGKIRDLSHLVPDLAGDVLFPASRVLVLVWQMCAISSPSG